MNLYQGYITLPEVVGDRATLIDAIARKIGTYISAAIAASASPRSRRRRSSRRPESADRAMKMTAVGAGLDTYDSQTLKRDFAEVCKALEKLEVRSAPQGVLDELG